uniref:C3 and PZP-like alpha-2-macroglobulin domain-containing protein 8 n=1 Tax=Sphaerodactylus townsendi TaxID=933632 RepID=A0ACB8F2G9_9SAUR
MTHFSVAVKAHNNAHIALSGSPHDTAEMTEIVIGGHQNSRTWISSSKMGEPVASAETAGLLAWEEFRSFWISWSNGVIQVGHGPSVLNESVIVSWAAPRPPEVKYIGFSTGWGSVGEFKIWRKEEADENHNEAFTLGVPHNVIPGSEKATASVIGEVMGPILNNLDNLLQLPFGCGEQNMIHFAPNVFVLKYLQKTKQLSPEVENEATDYLVQGYQRQLTYKRQDGSYSAFGERDSSGSMWLAGSADAEVLLTPVSGVHLHGAPRSCWQPRAGSIQHQKEEACLFQPREGSEQNFPWRERMRGGSSAGNKWRSPEGANGRRHRRSLSCAELHKEEDEMSVAKAKLFLESNVYSVGDPYTTVLMAYALTLLRSPLAPAALHKMNSQAITQDGITHWSFTGTPAANEDTFVGFNDGHFRSVVSAEVEMTAYALLTYAMLGDVASALPVVKWLSQQRNALGGFSSTQDTCVALQALAEYAILSYTGGVNLTVSLASTNLDYQETFELNKANRKLLQTTRIPSIPTGLFVSAKGDGCCLLKIDVSYNVPDPVAKPAFQLLVNLQEPKHKHHRRAPGAPVPPSPNKNRLEASHWGMVLGDDDDPASEQDHQEYTVAVEVCMRWLHSGSSNMAVLEVPLLSGFQADIESLEQLLLNKQTGLKRYEVDGRKVLFYFDEVGHISVGSRRSHPTK